MHVTKQETEAQLHDFSKIMPVASGNVMTRIHHDLCSVMTQNVPLALPKTMLDNTGSFPRIAESNTVMFSFLFLNNQVPNERLTTMILLRS